MRGIVFLQGVPGFEAVADGDNLVSPISKVRRQDMTGNRIILGDQYLQINYPSSFVKSIAATRGELCVLRTNQLRQR